MPLRRIQRRTAPFQIAAGLGFADVWVESLRMPADAPSRNRALQPKSAHPEAWVKRLLAGEPGALASHLGWTGPSFGGANLTSDECRPVPPSPVATAGSRSVFGNGRAL